MSFYHWVVLFLFCIAIACIIKWIAVIAVICLIVIVFKAAGAFHKLKNKWSKHG